MGLGGSKQPKDITVSNSESQIIVTNQAFENIINTAKESSPKKETKQERIEGRAADLDLRLLPDLHDKRIEEYEKNLIEGLNKSSKEVENLFRERYSTMPVCIDLQNKVIQCYTENPKTTLNCLDIANQFIKCVEQERQSKFGLFDSKSSKNTLSRGA